MADEAKGGGGLAAALEPILAGGAIGLDEMDKSKARKQSEKERIQKTTAYEDTSQRAEATRRALFKGYTSALAGTMGSLGMDTSAMTSQMAADPRAGTFRHLPAYQSWMDDPRGILDGERTYTNEALKNRKEMTDEDAFGIRNNYMQEHGIQGLGNMTPQDSDALTGLLKEHYAKWGENFDPKILQDQGKKSKSGLGSIVGGLAGGLPGLVVGNVLGNQTEHRQGGDWNQGGANYNDNANPGDRMAQGQDMK